MVTAKAVMTTVNGELRHGLRARERRQNRISAILSASSVGTSSTGFLVAPCPISYGVLIPLGRACEVFKSLSTFLRSSVSECLVTSNLAEVKVFFGPWP